MSRCMGFSAWTTAGSLPISINAFKDLSHKITAEAFPVLDGNSSAVIQASA
ncbi:hypothetical protein [Paenibacillus algorifonticola]|uniref:hypothetical protein n=1 Tax=Paenibacillus algorifonticola TaxID=684063 RepID=UPI0012E1A7DD|nr:hypothetical protein [Paenibacillus algorifonticola]